jgi:hypothetical protein
MNFQENEIIVVKQGWVDWLQEHGKTLLYVVLGVILVLFAAFHWMARSKGSAYGDYVSAHSTYLSWASGAKQDEPLLNKLKGLLDRHPELHAKYDPLIAQRLLTENDSALALNTLKRIGKEAPYFAQFAHASLLISQGSFSAALEEAQRLKQALEVDDLFWEKQSQAVRHGSSLYAFNLLRIAMLEQKVGTADGERLAWEELEKKEGKTYHPEAMFLLEQAFREQDLSLKDYIAYRKAQL